MIAITIILSVISGIMYRMGGSGNYPRWTRPVGLMVCVILELFALGYHHWIIIICGGLTYASSTTYFKKEGTDAGLLNWAMVGLAFGLSLLPLGLVYHCFAGIAVRTIVCALVIMGWSGIIGKDVVEEFGRGVIVIATVPLIGVFI